VNLVMSKEDFMSIVSDYTPPTSNKMTFGCGTKLDPFSCKFINTGSFFPFSASRDDKLVCGWETRC
jgi:hypothetical protein